MSRPGPVSLPSDLDAAGSFDDLSTTFGAVTGGVDAATRVKVFAATAEPS
jgi:hypothetical protein